MFFSEEKIIEKIMEYSNKPKFKRLMRDRIKEVLADMKEERIHKKDSLTDREEIKKIVTEVLNEIKGEKTLKKRIMETTVESAVEREVHGTIKLFRMLISGENLYVMAIIAFFAFFITSFIKHSLTLYILSLITLLMIMLVSYAWRKLHNTIFESEHSKKHS